MKYVHRSVASVLWFISTLNAAQAATTKIACEVNAPSSIGNLTAVAYSPIASARQQKLVFNFNYDETNTTPVLRTFYLADHVAEEPTPASGVNFETWTISVNPRSNIDVIRGTDIFGQMSGGRIYTHNKAPFWMATILNADKSASDIGVYCVDCAKADDAPNALNCETQ